MWYFNIFIRKNGVVLKRGKNLHTSSYFNELFSIRVLYGYKYCGSKTTLANRVSGVTSPVSHKCFILNQQSLLWSCWREWVLSWPEFYPRPSRAAMTAPTQLLPSQQSVYQPQNTEVSQFHLLNKPQVVLSLEYRVTDSNMTDRLKPFLAGCIWTKLQKWTIIIWIL